MGAMALINILNESESKKIKFYDNFNQCVKDAFINKHLVVFFIAGTNKKKYRIIDKIDFPFIEIVDANSNKCLIPNVYQNRSCYLDVKYPPFLL